MLEGVENELIEMGYAKENVETYLKLFDEVSADVTGIHYLKEKLGKYLPEETAQSMELIMSSVEEAKECEFNLKFDTDTGAWTCLITQEQSLRVTMDDFGGSVSGWRKIR